MTDENTFAWDFALADSAKELVKRFDVDTTRSNIFNPALFPRSGDAVLLPSSNPAIGEVPFSVVLIAYDLTEDVTRHVIQLALLPDFDYDELEKLSNQT